MIDEMRNSWPLPKMHDDMTTILIDQAADASRYLNPRHASAGGAADRLASQTPVDSRASAGVDLVPDDTLARSEVTNTAGEAGVVGAPPHPTVIMSGSWSWPPIETPDEVLIRRSAELRARYEAHRRAYAEAIGRPYPDERHPVWPR